MFTRDWQDWSLTGQNKDSVWLDSVLEALDHELPVHSFWWLYMFLKGMKMRWLTYSLKNEEFIQVLENELRNLPIGIWYSNPSMFRLPLATFII